MRLLRLAHPGLVVLVLAATMGPLEAGLRDELGRNETRVFSARFPLEPGRTVAELDLARRLERRGYTRVRGRRPERAGEYFWGHDRFWIYRHRVETAGQRHRARLIGLELQRPDGLILRGVDADLRPLASRKLWLEPILLAESLDADRALTRRVRLADLPERVWRPVLAAEDARFFDHVGLDARSLARALLANARAGKVVQGGSTITQQLVKLRDLSPKRSLGRKASEAVRALALEADHDKTEILEAYLNAIYYGHLDGVHLYGLGTAASAFFSKPAASLSMAEAALLAAMIQGPNRLSPVRNPEAARVRYRWVLGRLRELGWAAPDEISRAERDLPRLRPVAPPPTGARHLLDWIESDLTGRAPALARRDRGVVVHSTLDPLVQRAAEDSVRRGLDRLVAASPRLRNRPLSAALVALDGRNGDVLAYVGGHPDDRTDGFDRARRASRQPGSAVKPLVLLEAFQACGKRKALYPARRVSDRPLTLQLPSGAWSPQNPDRRFRDAVSLRRATVASLNVPFVRAARWCGFEPTARRLRRAGLALPAEPGPAFVLGAVETTPLDLARAYTVFSSLGRSWRPRPWSDLHLPSGTRLERRESSARKVVKPAAAYLVRDLLEQSLEEGPAAAGAPGRPGAFGKTGTSSASRDAWFAGGAGSVVAVVWVGLDDGGELGLSGSRAPAPLWRDFMTAAVPLRPAHAPPRPARLVERWIQSDTGLLTSRRRRDTELEIFRRGATPPKRRIWRRDPPVPVIE
mgnify:CR=1 FL=1